MKSIKLFSLAISILYCHDTLAVTQYLGANVVYGDMKDGTYDTVQKAIAATEKQICIGGGAFNCRIAYTGDFWHGNTSRWVWTGIYYYDTKNTDGTFKTFGPFDYAGGMNLECPTGWTAGNSQALQGLCFRNIPVVHCDVCDKQNPVPTANGSMIISGRLTQKIETDYSNASGSLQFTRTYRSDEKRWTHNYDIGAVNLNASVPSSSSSLCLKTVGLQFGKSCLPYMGANIPNGGLGNNFVVRRGFGPILTFGSSSDLLPRKDVNDRLNFIAGSEGNGITVYNASTDATEYFGSNDKISKSVQRNGDTTSFFYSDTATPKEIAPDQDFLISVVDPSGRQIDFTYDENGKMSTMKTPTGDVFKYSYSADGNLTSVTDPDGNQKNYLYNESAKTQGGKLPFALTSIMDPSGNNIEEFNYDSTGALLSNNLGGNIGKNTISSYSDNYVVMTGPLGGSTTYTYSEVLGVKKISSVMHVNSIGNNVFTRYEYDANGNISAVQAFDNTRTTYVYDPSRNLESSRTEAVGTSAARTISTEWDPLLPLATRIAEPRRLTINSYDQAGNLLKKVVQATSDASGTLGFNAVVVGTPRIFTYTYNDHGQMLTQRGPRTDVNDTTTYAYDTEQNLISITDALGHKTVFSNYDANGHVGRIEDPNGLVSELTYTASGRLRSQTIGGATTTFSYDTSGNVADVTLPNGAAISYSYDTSHRLTGIKDSLGNSIAYTLDAMGNRVNEKVTDPSGFLTRQVSRGFSALGLLKLQTGGHQ
ncbi:RHS repeat protein [Duganella aquatilis]|nr:RHS repeat protein [Duganella aquatilis]